MAGYSGPRRVGTGIGRRRKNCFPLMERGCCCCTKSSEYSGKCYRTSWTCRSRKSNAAGVLTHSIDAKQDAQWWRDLVPRWDKKGWPAALDDCTCAFPPSAPFIYKEPAAGGAIAIPLSPTLHFTHMASASDENHGTAVPSVTASITGPSAIQRSSTEKHDEHNEKARSTASPVPTDPKDSATVDTNDENRYLSGRKLLAVFTGMLLS
jgi:hypothetical protein